LRTGNGAKNMGVVRHFALNLARKVADQRSINWRRKRARHGPLISHGDTGAGGALTSTRCPGNVAQGGSMSDSPVS
jgi:hypothetical protein